MTIVNLDYIGIAIQDRRTAVEWLYNRYGPAGDLWEIKKLTYVHFKNDKHATYFTLRFS